MNNSNVMEEKQNSGFVLTEIKGDLFSCPTSDSLAHCVSKDLAMGKGIAVHFKNKFGEVKFLKDQNKNVGEVAKLKINLKDDNNGQSQTRFVYYMITKTRYFDKPTLKTMESSLNYLRDQAISDGVQVISMPEIGCGLDRLKWSDVKGLINEIFKNTTIKINIYQI